MTSRLRNLNVDNVAVRQRTRPAPSPALSNGGPTTEMVAKAREAFLANKEANAASARSRKAIKELAVLMTKGEVENFEFTATSPTGAAIPARAAIEETVTEEISVEKLRNLVDDATFMRIIKAAKGAVEAEAGPHIAIKASQEVTKPAELKVKEVKA